MKKLFKLPSVLIAASIVIAPIAIFGAVDSASAETIPSSTTTTTTATTLKPGTSHLSRATGSWADGSAKMSTKLAALPQSGGGLYAGVRVREATGGYYLAHTHIYPDGTVQASIRRVITSNGGEQVTMLGSRANVSTKAKAGSTLSIGLQVAGAVSPKLSATVTVGGGTPLTLTATDIASTALRNAGTSAVWTYLSTSTPAVPVAPITFTSTPASTSPAPAPTPTPTPAPTPTPTPAPSPTPAPNPTPAPGAYPDDSTTGVPAGTHLTVHNGDLDVTTPNAVIDSLEVHGLVIIDAPGVVIKNSRILGRTVTDHVGLVSNVRSGLPFTIVDSEIYAANPSAWQNGIFASAFTAIRVDIHDVVDPVRVIGDNVEVRDSWLHNNLHYESDPTRGGTPSHDDSIQIEAGNHISIVGNRLEDAHNAAVQITQNTSKSTLGNIRIAGNHLNNGGCTVNIARTPAPIGTLAIADNLFGPDRTFSGCGILAPVMNAPQLSGDLWEATHTPVAYTVLK